jgi:hypothetical protein
MNTNKRFDIDTDIQLFFSPQWFAQNTTVNVTTAGVTTA